MGAIPIINRIPILLHACCGPCATWPLTLLAPEYETTLFFFNPNIHPLEEFQKRRREIERLGTMVEVPLILIEPDPGPFEAAVAGLETLPEKSDRCRECFRLRLERTADACLERGFSWFSTTLTISPWKDARLVNSVGRLIAARKGLNFLEKDFKKEGGFAKSVALSKEMGFYRQKY
jgi:epoxyqueuosine reductase